MRDFQLPGRSPVFAANALCATSHPLATQTAIQVLKDGGNAVDAAIAASVMLGLCEPASSGIGGDAFVLLKPPGEERIIGLNGSGRSPRGLDAAAIRASGRSRIGSSDIETVTLPGAIDAFCRLSEDWGRLGLDAVLAPAIRYAEDGIPVSSRVAFDWANHQDRLQGAARRWFLKDGKPPHAGDLWRHQGQAEVLRRVAKEGRAGFYAGDVAADMVAPLRALGGTHDLEDFAAVRSDYTEPVSGFYRGLELVEHPPNGQGATAILMAHILAQFDLAGMDPHGVARMHLEIEAAKLAYDARDRFIADPEAVTRLPHLLDPATGVALARLIDPDSALDMVTRRTEAIHRDTVYMCVVDRDGMAVSMIYSTYYAFGSGLASEKFGVPFHNRGAGFTLEPGHPNEAGPGKRPLHTIIPAMAKQDGRVVMPFGVMGGGYQPTGHVHVLSNLVDFGMDVQEAIDSPRAFYEDSEVRVERGFSPAVRAGLTELGHHVVEPRYPIGGGQAIWIDHARGVLIGGSDPRKDGLALGY